MPSINAVSMLIGGKPAVAAYSRGVDVAPLLFPNRVRSILNKFSASAFIAGVDGVLRFGFQPGNYTDSSGTILAASNDGVGRVNDAGFGGINATQATAGFKPYLRNTGGVQSWQFDGTDDRLSLSAVPFQMADDHFVVAGFRNDSKAALRAQFSVSGSDQTRIAQVYTHTNGGVRVVWRDGSGAVQNEVVSSVDVTGTAVIASCAKRLGRLIGRLDGAQFGDIASGSFGAFNPIAASVGANTGVLGFFANGHIHGVVFGKGAITDAELLTLEKFMAQLQGRTL